MNPNFGSRSPTARGSARCFRCFRNAFTITMVVLIVSMLVLSQIGIDIAPLLAGAGVVGLAIGFGAQKFVQDIITGAFIQIQNAMNEGDIVELNGVSGTVEQVDRALGRTAGRRRDVVPDPFFFGRSGRQLSPRTSPITSPISGSPIARNVQEYQGR